MNVSVTVEIHSADTLAQCRKTAVVQVPADIHSGEIDAVIGSLAQTLSFMARQKVLSEKK